MRFGKRVLGTLMLILTVGSVMPESAVTNDVASPQTAEVSAIDAADQVSMQGRGWLSILGCIGCMAGIGLMGGGSVLGLAVLAATAPEIVAGCALGCVAAFM